MRKVKIKKGILVTGAGGPPSIGFCRSLLKSKDLFFLVGTDIDPFKIHHANTHKKYLVPDPSDPSYLKVLNMIIEKNNIVFLHSQPDQEIKIIAKFRHKLKTKTLLPEYKTIEIAQNKFRTQKTLELNDIPVPRSILIDKLKDIKRSFKELKSPIWFRAVEGNAGKGSLLIGKERIAESWVKFWKGFGNFMACEYLPGKNIGWDSIWLDGKLIICHTKERLSYAVSKSSPSGISGTADVVRSIKRIDIEKLCKKVILSIDKSPSGAFSVDLKEDRNGKPFVTEINPGRFLNSSLHFFAESGFNMPAIFVKLALGQKINLDFKYPSGTYMVRSLDARPILLTENYIAHLFREKKAKKFFEVKKPNEKDFY